MLPLYITAASATDGGARFVDSLRAIKEEAQFVFVQFQPHFPKTIDNKSWILELENAQQIKYTNIPYPGNLGRNLWLLTTMRRLNMFQNTGRWVIFSDTEDVVWQRPIPSVDQGRQMYLSGEGLTFRQSKFWMPYIKKYGIFKPLIDRQIYNAGIFMMRMNKVKSYLEFLESKAKVFADVQVADQLLFNLWVSQQDERYAGYHPSLMVSLYKNLELGNVKKEGKMFVNRSGVPFSVVHANGNTKEMLEWKDEEEGQE